MYNNIENDYTCQALKKSRYFNIKKDRRNAGDSSLICKQVICMIIKQSIEEQVRRMDHIRNKNTEENKMIGTIGKERQEPGW